MSAHGLILVGDVQDFGPKPFRGIHAADIAGVLILGRAGGTGG